LRQHPAAIEFSDDNVGAKALLGGERVQVRGKRSDRVDVSAQLIDRRGTCEGKSERQRMLGAMGPGNRGGTALDRFIRIT
jgi:hypothetical protein